jgi:uncharacterized protein (DUF2249 family)
MKIELQALLYRQGLLHLYYYKNVLKPLYHIMTINADTKIASILKERAAALEAIVSINDRFKKLRNPVLRKLMAGRTSLAMAAKMGGCTVDAFYEKLAPLGFAIGEEKGISKVMEKERPHFMELLKEEGLTTLDVRPLFASGQDPLQVIMAKIKTVQQGQALKIINSFEPTPLIVLLEKKGFETYSYTINKDLVETYFYKPESIVKVAVEKPVEIKNDWESVLDKFEDHLQKLDVRQLEMPQPMHAILESLDALPINYALYVYHKRIPVYLLPELAERGFEYRIKEIKDGEVRLLIFRS